MEYYRHYIRKENYYYYYYFTIDLLNSQQGKIYDENINPKCIINSTNACDRAARVDFRDGYNHKPAQIF